jgi:hypothetical protein
LGSVAAKFSTPSGGVERGVESRWFQPPQLSTQARIDPFALLATFDYLSMR